MKKYFSEFKRIILDLMKIESYEETIIDNQLNELITGFQQKLANKPFSNKEEQEIIQEIIRDYISNQSQEDTYKTRIESWITIELNSFMDFLIRKPKAMNMIKTNNIIKAYINVYDQLFIEGEQLETLLGTEVMNKYRITKKDNYCFKELQHYVNEASNEIT